MYATNVRTLKKNPSAALRHAEEGPVVVLKGNHPNAVILHLEPEQSIGESEQVLLPALAASLYKDGTLSLGAAAQLSKMGLSPFADHLSSLGVEIVGEDETTESEQGDLNRWLAP
ncbi:MAG: prevent-host-death protein [Gammaproteobacteria bacterium]|jgi:predicted HTH domain antitoxin|nr:prevent-host-death protein [Gammaproteobacteria bacterium]MBT4811048.1 prevent-host-death protein [Thiotrichales bacterium]MBT3471391.1 prevent-host-death protein [Gammaproteobacteria bacterium]MBT3967943.1 prevent-host-death protein [Gammaproteobacteria bacterium]MBT4081740.1 prevent-host-death protein [Gammaproteobacteria bacterium]